MLGLQPTGRLTEDPCEFAVVEHRVCPGETAVGDPGGIRPPMTEDTDGPCPEPGAGDHLVADLGEGRVKDDGRLQLPADAELEAVLDQELGEVLVVHSPGDYPDAKAAEERQESRDLGPAECTVPQSLGESGLYEDVGRFERYQVCVGEGGDRHAVEGEAESLRGEQPAVFTLLGRRPGPFAGAEDPDNLRRP